MAGLTDRVAVVTGAASGNGRAIALACARAGADVVVADIREEPREGGAPTVERIRTETDVDATFVECDVTSLSDLENAVEAAEAFGGVDTMVNNAGILRVEDFLDISESDYATTMDVNVKGSYFGAQAAIRRMVENDREGAIVNISSLAGFQGTGEYVTYCVSKGAVKLLTYALADYLAGTGIRVNAVHPGVTKTAMASSDVDIVDSDFGEQFKGEIPLGRFADPGEIADAVVYLASDDASYVTGESLLVDGGIANT